MSNRLDQEREKSLSGPRMDKAIKSITDLGYNIDSIDNTSLSFTFKGSQVRFFPYSGWHTGKTIKDGRGLRNLLNQIKF